ncbi:MAG: helix-turn-helix transcriptional regulator [Saprospiraceae bacterium]|nr:helix-turn-helix transcriptional regulator [Saprospiraceae bacterium]
MLAKRAFHTVELEVGASPVAGTNPEAWLNQFTAIYTQSMAAPDCTVESLAKKMHTSRTVLYRRVKESSGLTLREFCEILRLERARELLDSGEVVKIRALAMQVGYRDALRFSRKFRARYGVYPSACLPQKQRQV